MPGEANVVLGLLFGDEGKGRTVDFKGVENDMIVRGGGGANAGHTVVFENTQIASHQVPSGIAYPGKLNIIGNGVLLDPRRLDVEFDSIRAAGLDISPDNLLISSAAHLVMPHHVELDRQREAGRGAQGSTRSGIAFAAADKALRVGIRAEVALDDTSGLIELAYEGLSKAAQQGRLVFGRFHAWRRRGELREEAEDWVGAVRKLAPYVTDTVAVVNDNLRVGKRVLLEGAQAHWLDPDHGSYPNVTSSPTTVAGLLQGTGIAPHYVNEVTGVFKAVASRVGGGPFVTEIADAAQVDRIRGPAGRVDSEFGASTGRPRRIGYPDLFAVENAVLVNGVTEIAITKLDHVPRYGRTVLVATGYEYRYNDCGIAPTSASALSECMPIYKELPTWGDDISTVRTFAELPDEARGFVSFVEEILDVPVNMIGVGPRREQLIVR